MTNRVREESRDGALLFLVGPVVLEDITQLPEGLAANVAFEGLFSCMYPCVSLQMGLLREGPRAYLQIEGR